MKHRLLQALALNVLISVSGVMALPSFVNSAKDMAINTAKYSAAGYGELGTFFSNHKGGAVIGISATAYALYLLNKQGRLEKIKQWMSETKKWAKENPGKAVAKLTVRAFILGIVLNTISIILSDIAEAPKRRLLGDELSQELSTVHRMKNVLAGQEHEMSLAMIGDFTKVVEAVNRRKTEEEIAREMDQIVKNYDLSSLAAWRIAAQHRYEALDEAFLLVCSKVRGFEGKIATLFQAAAQNAEKSIMDERGVSVEAASLHREQFYNQAIAQLKMLKGIHAELLEMS